VNGPARGFDTLLIANRGEIASRIIGGVYLELLVRRARHVEVQAFGDGRELLEMRAELAAGRLGLEISPVERYLADGERLAGERAVAAVLFAGFDALALPTAPDQPTIAEAANQAPRSPVSLPTGLGVR
jgi:hypothetical protein